MAAQAGVAYVSIRFDRGDLERMQVEAKANGKLIADQMSSSVDRNSSLFRRLASGFEALGKDVQNTADNFGRFARESSIATGPLSALGSTISGLAPALGALTTGGAALGAALVVLPALAGAVTFAFVALLDVVTTLGAAVAALAGPLSIVGVLLGGLGAGFVLAGERAMKGGGPFKDFAETMHDLQKQFSGVVRTLAVDFLPYFDRLAGAARIALTYLGQIAKLPLKDAFESLSTTGVRMFSKFVYGVANVLKKPFRLAIQIAFGSGGQTAQSAITSWWDSLTRYLFGYQKTHPVFAPDGKWLGLTTTNVKGALDPILKWFERQHLTKTGLRWSNEIIEGFLASPGARNLERWARTTAVHAGHYAGRAFKATLSAELTNWFGPYFRSQWRNVVNPVPAAARQAATILKFTLGGAFDSIRHKAGRVWDSIKTAAGNAWDEISAKIEGVWDQIVGYIESHVPSVHIHVPSLPSLPGLPHFAGGVKDFSGGLALVGEKGPEIVRMPAGSDVIPNHAIAAGLGSQEIVLQPNIYIGGEKLDDRIDVRVDLNQRRTARRIQAGRKWSVA